ncbi:MAG TPA: hypothetical protein VFZ01_15770 [Geminicoccaceae bacterium]
MNEPHGNDSEMRATAVVRTRRADGRKSLYANAGEQIGPDDSRQETIAYKRMLV